VLAALIVQSAIDSLLYEDALLTANNRVEYVRNELDGDLDSIIAGHPPSAQSQEFLNDLQKAGFGFLYKIYDANGDLRMSSGRIPQGTDQKTNLAAHEPTAARAAQQGFPAVLVKRGEPPLPALYAEAYLPILRDGKVLGVVETYVDESARLPLFERVFAFSAIELGSLIAVAFAVPGAAWYLRGRKQKLVEAQARYLAEFDEVTALVNRRRLARTLEDVLTQRAATAPPIAVYCIDIDDFSPSTLRSASKPAIRC